jgi:aminoglycoside/choline kinase family phosphotransferase
MPSYRAFTVDDALRVAARALSQARGEAVSLALIGNLGDEERRNLVLRATATAADGSMRRVFVKATRAADYDAASPTAFATFGFVKEWAAVTMLAEHAARGDEHAVGVRLLAADPDQGVMVFEDAGDDPPLLVGPLLHGSPEEAEAALTAYARALGHLHVATWKCRAEHEAVVKRTYPLAEVPAPGRRWIEAAAKKLPELLGGTLPAEEVDALARRLESPGDWLSLVHRDPCPDNAILSGDGTAILVDFEFASLGHMLLDASYWRMGFPTCWCAGRVPAEVAARIERVYRSTIAAVVRAAADNAVFHRERALMATAWVFDMLSWILEDALKEDGTWGISSYRNRILHYLDASIALTGEAEVLPAIRSVFEAWRDLLRARWPKSSPLALYPAFAGADGL